MNELILTSLLLVAAVFATPLPTPSPTPSPTSDGRDQVAEPSAEELEYSVERYSIEGSVERLVQQSDTSITLGSDVLFAFNSAEVDERARDAVTALLGSIPQGATVSVEGHTDSRGGDAINVPLSQNRAQAVADLVASERPDLILSAQGFAATRPVANEYPGGSADYDAMAKNRRVELVVQP